MTRVFVLFLLIFFAYFSFSQKSEVVYKSKISHNYAIGRIFYLESNIDTSRLILMGVIKVISSSQDLFLLGALNLIEIKTKEMNGNSFKLRSHSIIDTTLYLVFNVYFSPEKILDINRKSKVKGKTYVFNTIKDTMYRQICVNGKMHLFRRDKYIEMITSGKSLTIRLDSNLYGVSLNHKTEANAVFYTIKLIQPDKNTTDFNIKNTKFSIVSNPGSNALTLRYRPIDFNYESIYQLDYSTGRLMMDVYARDNTTEIAGPVPAKK